MQFARFNGERWEFSSGSAGGSMLTKLWENPSPSSSFSAKTISLDLSGYTAIAVQFHYSNATETASVRMALVDGSAYEAFQLNGIQNSGITYVGRRTFTVTTTRVAFAAAYHKATNSTASVSADNGYMIPVAIYGIK